MTPEQLTSEGPTSVEKLQRMALQRHLEARQASDLRRDIAQNLRPSQGVFSPGQRVWYYE